MKKEKHVTVIIVPSLSFNELNWLIRNGKYKQLWNKGAFGAINLRPDGDYSYLNNMVSISTGKRAVGVLEWNAYESGEEVDGHIVENLILQWTGNRMTSPIVHPHFHRLKAKNETANFRADIGSFGEKLYKRGVYASILGHSDTKDEQIRYGSLLVLDKEGKAEGELYSIVDRNNQYPSGLLTNKEMLVDKILEIEKNNVHSFTVVEWGDLHRLFSEKHNMERYYFDHIYEQLLFHLEDLLFHIKKNTKSDLWLISPYVNKEAYVEKKQLGPLWYWNGEEDKKFTFYSFTTRKNSLISNTDLVNTWLASFAIEDRILNAGEPLQLKEKLDWSYENFQKRLDEIYSVYKGRKVVLSTYVSTLVIMLLFVSIMLIFFKDSVWKNRLLHILLSGVLSPLLFLITSPFIRFLSPLVYVLFIIIFSVALAFFITKLTMYPFSIACFVFAIIMCFDLFAGGYFIERSFLGFDPIIGARYYGIGNEYAGIYIASTILMLAPILKMENKTQVFFIMTFISFFLVVTLGSSSLGANAGASLAVVMMMLFLLFHLYLRKHNIFVKIVVVVLFWIAMFFSLYLLQAAQPTSHISIAFHELLQGNYPYIFDIVKRKLQMNWKIFKVSYWTQLFVTSYILAGVILWRRKKDELTFEQSLLIHSMIICSIGLLLLNDSGVVAAATSMFITVSVYYGWKMK